MELENKIKFIATYPFALIFDPSNESGMMEDCHYRLICQSAENRDKPIHFDGSTAQECFDLAAEARKRGDI